MPTSKNKSKILGCSINKDINIKIMNCLEKGKENHLQKNVQIAEHYSNNTRPAKVGLLCSEQERLINLVAILSRILEAGFRGIFVCFPTLLCAVCGSLQAF